MLDKFHVCILLKQGVFEVRFKYQLTVGDARNAGARIMQMSLPGRELQNQVMTICDKDTLRLILLYHYNGMMMPR